MPAKPLAILTRPRELNAPLAQALVDAGWNVTIAPALQIDHRNLAQGESLPNPADFDLVVFVSGNAVSGYAHQWGGNCVWPASTAAACVGLATAQSVREAFGASLKVLHPAAQDVQDSEALWRVITRLDTKPRRVLIIRGQDGRDWLAEQYSAQGVNVQIHVAYCRELATWTPELKLQFSRLAKDNIAAVWLLTSPHGIQSVVPQMQRAGLSSWASLCSYIVTHPRLVEVLRHSLADPACFAQIETSRGDLASLMSSFEKVRQNQHSN
jgi:uroporphyrinogen-III synthase